MFHAATKCIRVFSVMVVANKVGGKITDEKLKHAAAITAEWLDNNKRGLVDDVAVNNAIARRNGPYYSSITNKETKIVSEIVLAIMRVLPGLNSWSIKYLSKCPMATSMLHSRKFCI